MSTARRRSPKTKTIKAILREEFEGADTDAWEQGELLFVRRGDKTLVVGLRGLLATVAREQPAEFLHALDAMVIDKLIEKKLDLVPGQDTGTVSFVFPVTAYTKGLRTPS